MTKRKRLNVNDICMAVASLSKKERGLVREACDFGGVDDSRSKSIHDEDENFLLFYATFIEIMRETIGTKLSKNPSHLPPKWYRRLKSGWTVADDFLDMAAPGARLPQRTKFYRIIVLTVIDYINTIDKMPLITKTVIDQLQNSPALLHQQFPGYLQPGVMAMMLRVGSFSNTPDDEEF